MLVQDILPIRLITTYVAKPTQPVRIRGMILEVHLVTALVLATAISCGGLLS
jgi:hypothetical protein